jgi:DNA-binding response OmpR family regulator
MAGPGVTPRAPLVLVVDDDPLDVDLIVAHLAEARSERRFEIESVGLLADAQRRLAKKGVDVVLLDLNLPDAHGLSAVSRLVGAAADVPVVVLTGLKDETMGLRAVQQGAQDYLVKDQVDGNLLDRSLRFAMERKRAEQALARLAGIMAGMCYECGRKLEVPGRSTVES